MTIAGLVMFGKERSILDALPHYHLDYQEQLSGDPDRRWTYRLTIDGSWEPNLFNFYYRVYSRLISKGWLKSSGHGRGTRYQLGSSSEADLFSASSEHYAKLLAIAAPVREKGRANKHLMEKVVLELCADDFVTLRTLAVLLNPEPDSVRNHYVAPMVKRGALELRYAAHPNHPQQGYRTAVKSRNVLAE